MGMLVLVSRIIRCQIFALNMSASFRSIVQQVTQEKLEELKQQRNLMNDHFNPILKQVEEPVVNPAEALQILYETVNNTPVKDIIDPILIENLKYVLKNSKGDTSLSSQLLLAWIEKLKEEIQYALRKCEYSYLYGSLLSEWLDLEERKAARKSGTSETEEDLSGLKEKAKQDKEELLSKIRALMFAAPLSDDFEPEKFRKFLSDELLNFEKNAEGQSIMKEIRRESGEFFKIVDYQIHSFDVQCCIKGLCTDELLSPEKKAALKELSENSEALEEVASLLTNRLRNLNRWQWPSSCEVVELRRGLAGEYKAFMNEDIITALFLQYVGVQWASYFKAQFVKIYESKIFADTYCLSDSIEAKRIEFHQSTFLSGLPDSMHSQDNKHEEEYVKVQSAKMSECEPVMMARSAAPQMRSFCFAESDAMEVEAPRRYMKKASPRSRRAIKPPPQDIDFKQAFLHTLSTEIRLHQVIQPDKPLVVVQADLESFGPSVVHDAALIALEYFGVSRDWIEFFKKFLQPRVSLVENETPKPVLRGVPTSHTLSSLFGETLLFLLDLLVNQKCDGMRIYRLSDEFWFWGYKEENVTKAWETINTYGKMVGLKIKEDRSGSVSIYSDEAQKKLEISKTILCGPSPLPQRSIHWGYLELHSNGIFKIDQNSIAKFLDEMRALLDKSECVLEWINVFNKYMAFFVRNFGKCALVSGKQHLDQIITSLGMIYAGLFGSENGNPVEKLKSRFEKLREADIVDVWAYWPLERGGLGLVNPFIGPMSLREAYVDINDDDYFTKLPLKDKDAWEAIIKEHERRYGKIDATRQVNPGYAPPPKVPTWDEYLAKRETELSHWYQRYIQMLERPGPKTILVSEKYWTLDTPLPDDEIDRNYLIWLFAYYETQLVLHFGSVKFINSKLLPMSMIANIQKSKVEH
ncbi:hypothetical protein Bhyg_03898 [Pseudolycoriella hygida]|uniref:Reverse transcriptase domain-containing protein n=1 Tax=Pseudolycoriella hygida TaxID=35572 RepID=A0A9Q0S7X3_9DIPT|nr:hypothetical protein Bhyg_03898 [Pseudolycoriella hygida]